MFPDPLNGLIRFARFQKNCHANDISIAGLVHQMSDHIVGFSVYVLFAGTVKVELRQLVRSVPRRLEDSRFPPCHGSSRGSCKRCSRYI